MKCDTIDMLLQLLYLEGGITLHGAYEKSLLRAAGGYPVPEGSREKLLRRLEASLAFRIPSSRAIMTIGSYLTSIRSRTGAQSGELYTRLGLSVNQYRLLERDKISPLQIPGDVWRRFRRLFNLPVNELVGMVRRTHTLVFFQPSFRAVLARYDARRSRALRTTDLENAARELFAKAVLKLPEDEETRLAALLKEIAG